MSLVPAKLGWARLGYAAPLRTSPRNREYYSLRAFLSGYAEQRGNSAPAPERSPRGLSGASESSAVVTENARRGGRRVAGLAGERVFMLRTLRTLPSFTGPEPLAPFEPLGPLEPPVELMLSNDEKENVDEAYE